MLQKVMDIEWTNEDECYLSQQVKQSLDMRGANVIQKMDVEGANVIPFNLPEAS